MKAITVAAFTSRPPIDIHSLRGKVLGEGLALGALAGNPLAVVVLATAYAAASSSSVALALALRVPMATARSAAPNTPTVAVNLILQLGDQQLLLR